jgi:hypothetical protein
MELNSALTKGLSGEPDERVHLHCRCLEMYNWTPNLITAFSAAIYCFQQEVWEVGIESDRLAFLGPEGRLYRDFRVRFWELDYPSRLLARIERVKVDVALEGSQAEAKIKIPPDPVVLDTLLTKRTVNTVLLQPMVRGLKISQRCLREMDKVARARGAKVVFDDSLTYLSSPTGAVGLLGNRPDYVIRRTGGRWLIFGTERGWNGLPRWSTEMEKGVNYAKLLERELKDASLNVTIHRVGNVVSIFTLPFANQYRDLVAMNWRRLRRVRFSMLCKGFVTTLPQIFLTHLHWEEDVINLSRGLTQTLREVRD